MCVCVHVGESVCARENILVDTTELRLVIRSTPERGRTHAPHKLAALRGKVHVLLFDTVQFAKSHPPLPWVNVFFFGDNELDRNNLQHPLSPALTLFSRLHFRFCSRTRLFMRTRKHSFFTLFPPPLLSFHLFQSARLSV